MPSDAVQGWLEKAAEDEQVVAVIRAASGPWAQAAYHVQQAAEKRVKAALVASGIAPPKTHDLAQLVNLFPGDDPPESVQESAAMLSAYAWLTRYPGAPPIEETHVSEAEAHLAAIRAWTAEVISRDQAGP